MTLFDPPEITGEELERNYDGVAAARAALDAARTGRDAAVGQVEENAPPEWLDYAFEFLEWFLGSHAEMHVDDLWQAGLVEPPNKRALGPVIKRAARAGLMVATGEYRPSTSSHLAPKPVWQSLVYRPATPEENPE